MSQTDTFLDLQAEDNLSIVDKMAGPNVSFIQRFLEFPLLYNGYLGTSEIGSQYGLIWRSTKEVSFIWRSNDTPPLYGDFTEH